MSASKNSTDNVKFIKLANQIEKLTKIVDNLQEEVKAMKRKSYRDNESQDEKIKNGKTIKKSEIIENKSKTNPFEKLRFFRKNDEINEKNDTYMDYNKKKDKEDISKNKARNDQQLGKIKKIDATDLPITRKKKRSHLTHLNPNNNEISNKQSDLICSVKDCSVQTKNDNQEFLIHRKMSKHKAEKISNQLDKKIESKSKSKSKSTCEGCAISSNLKIPKCSTDCPYLDKRRVIDNIDNKTEIEKKESNFKKDKVESNVQTSNNQGYVSDDSIKHFKNKKIMVNLIPNDNDKALINFKDDENFQINCKFIENVDLSNIRNLKRKSTDTVNSSTHVVERPKEKKNGCKQCFQNLGPKTVLKINKAILAPDPPMIFLSSKAFRKSESRHRKKSLIQNCEKFLKRRKCKRSCSDYEPLTCRSHHHDELLENNFNSFSCACSNFAASQFTVGVNKTASNGHSGNKKNHQNDSYYSRNNEDD